MAKFPRLLTLPIAAAFFVVACGTGGATVSGGVEMQGDLRDRIREVLTKKGWTVKG